MVGRLCKQAPLANLGHIESRINRTNMQRIYYFAGQKHGFSKIKDNFYLVFKLSSVELYKCRTRQTVLCLELIQG